MSYQHVRNSLSESGMTKGDAVVTLIRVIVITHISPPESENMGYGAWYGDC